MTRALAPIAARPRSFPVLAAAPLAAVTLLFVLGVTATTAAAAKPKVAVLGLEVGGELDATITQVAKDLTRELRERAKQSGPYQYLPGTERELIDEKLMNNCQGGATSCMAAIGASLGVDFLVYGTIEKTSQGYSLQLRLLKIAPKGTLQNTHPDTLPFNSTGRDPLAKFAKTVYAKLTGSDIEGTLTIRVPNVDRGTLYIDDQKKGELNGGTITVTLPENRYKAAVEADGFKRWEEWVTITATAPTTKTFELVRGSTVTAPGIKDPGTIYGSGTLSDDESGSGWRKAAYISGGAAVVLGVGFALTWNQLRKTGGSFPDYGANCVKNASDMFVEGSPPQCENGSLYLTGSYITGIGMVVTGSIAAIAIYKGFIASRERPAVDGSSVVRRTKRKRDGLTVTPVVSPEGAGATLRFDW